MERSELTVNGYQIPIGVSGEGDRCIVCVNAAQQTMSAWRGLLKPFIAAGGYRVVLFDFPNQGRGPATAPLDLWAQTEIVHAVIEHASSLAPVDLCGASWGAIIAAAAAARYPDAIRRLLLGSFQVRISERLGELCARSLEMLERGASQEIGPQWIAAFGAGLPVEFQEAMRKQFGRMSPAEQGQMRMQCRQIAARTDLRDVVDLDRITARTLIINGADDPLIGEAELATTAHHFPRAVLRVMPNVGHFLHLEDPRLIDDYIRFVGRRSTAFTRTRISAVIDAMEFEAA